MKHDLRPGQKLGIEIYPGPNPHTERKSIDVDPLELTMFLAQVATDKSASDVLAIDIGNISSFASYFLILTASNVRLLHSVVDELRDRARDEYGLHVRVEGDRSEEWILLDFGSLIVHCFSAEAREFYQLERLWSDAAHLDIPAPTGAPK
ncbi:ribosome silencing factor [Ferrimicrobium acidiphilum]|uniref:Ribosomal silencing factor RsfS n=1 Tax=Ferrimicrobium acidiphilum DSM 19497 TaxID=1121877 RepID=A0A0D8FYF7_9ACTN|nr:ribosome silencing factor [Ferrimicrobium acidiphilum]KJE78054.1 ribosomal silencing factor RsfS [Ferrimicrobium acidiphilum DSM 19497]MCL5053245.1 ribosome silencing factor [Gammaproteobacteria bacterium]